MSNRREFLKLTCGAAGLMAFEQGLDRFGLIANAAAAAPPNSYRALVCIFMFGGNDSNNMLIPVGAGGGNGYTAYANARGGSLAIAQGAIQPFASALPTWGLNLGVHTAMPEMKALFDQGRLAFVTNVGPLNQPTTKAQYNSNAAFRPYQLFSHSDQQSTWMSPRADVHTIPGWGGLVCDAVSNFNTGTSFPSALSLTGNNQFNIGQTIRPLNVAPAPTALNAIFPLQGFTAGVAIDDARRAAFNSLRTFDTSLPLVKAASDITQQGLDIQAALAVDPAVTATFPNSNLGNQLKQVAKIIKLNQTSLNVSRQVFFCSIGGFDTHQDELTSHTSLYGQISKAVKAFHDEMVAQNLINQVTTFTMSDFGRTMAPSGSGTGVGSDHAWGSHQMIMGGAIKQANIYGEVGLNGTPLQDMALGTAYDTDGRGRWIPTTAVDQYAATLGLWLGATSAELNTIFPNLTKFAHSDLGFLNP